MVAMSTFDEDLHPRGQASNAGQFRAKENTAPASSLDFEEDGGDILVTAGRNGALAALNGEPAPSDEEIFEGLVGHAPDESDADQVAEFADHYRFSYDLAKPSDKPIDVDTLLSNYASARAEKIGRVNVNDGDDEAYEDYEDAVMDSVDSMFEALQRYRAMEIAQQEADARPAKDIAVATVKRLAALDAQRLSGENAVSIATAAIEADRAARAVGAVDDSDEAVKLDPQPWRSEKSGIRYAQKPRDGHGPYRFMPQMGYSQNRGDYS